MFPLLSESVVPISIDRTDLASRKLAALVTYAEHLLKTKILSYSINNSFHSPKPHAYLTQRQFTLCCFLEKLEGYNPLSVQSTACPVRTLCNARVLPHVCIQITQNKLLSFTHRQLRWWDFELFTDLILLD